MVYIVEWYDVCQYDVYNSLELAQIAIVKELLMSKDNSPEILQENLKELFNTNSVDSFAFIHEADMH